MKLSTFKKLHEAAANSAIRRVEILMKENLSTEEIFIRSLLEEHEPTQELVDIYQEELTKLGLSIKDTDDIDADFGQAVKTLDENKENKIGQKHWI